VQNRLLKNAFQGTHYLIIDVAKNKQQCLANIYSSSVKIKQPAGLPVFTCKSSLYSMQ
jgi:hypothetical protein